jgi:hypothetical protein
MPVLSDARLQGLALFKSRHREEGRERFRLHLGYFQTVSEAERALAVVRPSWPRAMVAVVPEGSLGSLDNTAMTRFSIVEPVVDAAVEPPPAMPAKVTMLRAATLQPCEPNPEIPVITRSPPAPPVLTAIARPASEAEPATPVLARPAPTQRYAVQLAFGRTPIDLSALPDLAIYEGYLLYAIETEPGGRRLYGVRLGFYDDVLSARLVAQYVRSEFRDVTIVPVSPREVGRANAARIRLPSAAVTQRHGASLAWPKTALLVAFDPASHLSLAT